MDSIGLCEVIHPHISRCSSVSLPCYMVPRNNSLNMLLYLEMCPYHEATYYLIMSDNIITQLDQPLV